MNNIATPSINIDMAEMKEKEYSVSVTLKSI